MSQNLLTLIELKKSEVLGYPTILLEGGEFRSAEKMEARMVARKAGHRMSAGIVSRYSGL